MITLHSRWIPQFDASKTPYSGSKIVASPVILATGDVGKALFDSKGYHSRLVSGSLHGVCLSRRRLAIGEH